MGKKTSIQFTTSKLRYNMETKLLIKFSTLRERVNCLTNYLLFILPFIERSTNHMNLNAINSHKTLAICTDQLVSLSAYITLQRHSIELLIGIKVVMILKTFGNFNMYIMIYSRLEFSTCTVHTKRQMFFFKSKSKYK